MDLFVTKKADKEFSRIPKSYQDKLKKRLIYLKDNPYAGKYLEGEYRGLMSLRQWPYRIIYYIRKKEKEIWVVSITHRQGVYKN